MLKNEKQREAFVSLVTAMRNSVIPSARMLIARRN
jgi:hypothetical protein